MGRDLTSGKRASRWEGSSPVERPRELPSGKRDSQWEERFPVGREFYTFPVGKKLLNGKGVS